MSADEQIFPNHRLKHQTDEHLCSLDGCDITRVTDPGGAIVFVYFGTGFGEWTGYGSEGWLQEERCARLPESVIQMTEALWKLHS